MGDATRLRQILTNLLSNAVKFTETGEVVLSVTASPARDNKESSHASLYEIQFAVKDTGIGIPPERIDRLFKSFSQVDASTTRQYGGTGLGLAIGKQLSKIMGGRMWVESRGVLGGNPPSNWEPPLNLNQLELEQGSTFYFTVLAVSEPTSLPDENNLQQELKGKRLLIVDDNPTNRQILMLQTQHWGMLTRTAESGSEALDWIWQEPFDIAILDMQMPKMDGLTLAVEIRKQPEYQQLPLIMLTSIGSPETNSNVSAVNFSAFVTKPIKQSHIYNVLLNVLGEPLIQAKPSYPISLQSNQQLATHLPLRILLAEDNILNQKVALHLLQQIGYQADVVSNGLEALEALHCQTYDLVLMDVQMPKMDGLTVTRRICQEYSDAVRPRIVAMTANAMQGDREECLNAGMDDYVSKPIRLEELIQALKRCAQKQGSPGAGVPRCRGDREVGKPGDRENARFASNPITPSLHHLIPRSNAATSPQSLTPIDTNVLQAFRQMVGENDSDIVAEMIDCYLEEAPKLVQAIATAIAQADAIALRAGAHTLKSSSATLGATTLTEICLQLEVISRTGDTEASIDKLPQLEAEFARVKAALQVERQQPQA